MKFEIGAMSVGDILDRGLRLILARAPTFYLIDLLILAPFLVAQLLSGALQTEQVNPDNPRVVLLVCGVAAAVLVLMLLTLVLQPLGDGATLYVIWQEFVGQRVGAQAAFGFAGRRFLKLLFTAFLQGILVGIPVLMGFVAGLVPAALIAAVLGPQVGTVVGVVIVAVPTLAAFLGVMAFLVFANHVVVVEGGWGPAALGRSVELTRGFRWRVVGVLLLLVVIYLMVQAVTFVVDQYIPYYKVVQGELLPQKEITNYPLFVLTMLVEFLVSIVFRMYASVCVALLYFDVRIRKEGFDLEVAAGQLAGPSAGPELALEPPA